MRIVSIRPFLSDHHETLAGEIADFVEAEIDPLAAPEDDASARGQARAIAELLGGSSWLGRVLPDGSGGERDLPDLRGACLARDALASSSPLADAVLALQGLGSLPILLAGDESQREWLPEVVAGRAMAAFAMTEPEAGSDVSGMTTQARRDGDDWVLDGQKIFISNAGIADFYCVFAVTDPEAGRDGLSCFLVPADTNGLEFAGAQILSEPHPLGELHFDGCRVPGGAVLGGEGEGFDLGMRVLDRWRPTVAAAACGMAFRALAEATHHASERQQFGRPLARFQLIQAKLARMATDLDASRLLTYAAALAADEDSDSRRLMAAKAKYFATEAAQRIVDDAVQILGGRGVLAESPVDRLYRSVRALRIYEGATEIQQLIIARELLKN